MTEIEGIIERASEALDEPDEDRRGWLCGRSLEEALSWIRDAVRVVTPFAALGGHSALQRADADESWFYIMSGLTIGPGRTTDLRVGQFCAAHDLLHKEESPDDIL